MRLLSLILLLGVSLHARDGYALQLFAGKSENFQGLNQVLEKGTNAGLECYITEERREDGFYSFIRCNQNSNYQEISRSIQKAKRAGLTYYLLKPNNITNNSDTIKTTDVYNPVKDTQTTSTNIAIPPFFGQNRELMQILYNQNKISREYLSQRKASYLASIEAREKFNGLYLKGGTSNNFSKDRMDYNLRLEWDIFSGGYLESKKYLQKSLLQKDIEYEKIMDEYRLANLELSLYKMEAISNFINYYFLKEQEQIAIQMLQRSKKKYDASLITVHEFFSRKKAYDRVKQTIYYYEAIEKEQYDIRLKSLISNIEHINIAKMQSLVSYAYSNSFELKNTKNKIAMSTIQEDWKDKVKTNIYVENKKFLYLNDSDTIAGVQVQVPLDFKLKEDKRQEIETDINELKNSSLRKLIARNIANIYKKIEYHKNHIQTLKGDISFFKKEMKSLKLKSKYPLQQQKKDAIDEITLTKLSMSKLNQEIWQERTEILKLFIKLQNISGVQILATEPIN